MFLGEVVVRIAKVTASNAFDAAVAVAGETPLGLVEQLNGDGARGVTDGHLPKPFAGIARHCALVMPPISCSNPPAHASQPFAALQFDGVSACTLD